MEKIPSALSVLQCVGVCAVVCRCLLPCVGVYCSVWACVAVRRRVLQCVNVLRSTRNNDVPLPSKLFLVQSFCYDALQCVAVCCSLLQCVCVSLLEKTRHLSTFLGFPCPMFLLQGVARRCSVLQCVAACCSVRMFHILRKLDVFLPS